MSNVHGVSSRAHSKRRAIVESARTLGYSELKDMSPEFWSGRFRTGRTKISDIVPRGFWSDSSYFGPGRSAADQNRSAGILVRRTKITSDFGLTPAILVRGGLLRTKISDIVPRGFWSAGP